MCCVSSLISRSVLVAELCLYTEHSSWLSFDNSWWMTLINEVRYQYYSLVQVAGITKLIQGQYAKFVYLRLIWVLSTHGYSATVQGVIRGVTCGTIQKPDLSLGRRYSEYNCNRTHIVPKSYQLPGPWRAPYSLLPFPSVMDWPMRPISNRNHMIPSPIPPFSNQKVGHWLLVNSAKTRMLVKIRCSWYWLVSSSSWLYICRQITTFMEASVNLTLAANKKIPPWSPDSLTYIRLVTAKNITLPFLSGRCPRRVEITTRQIPRCVLCSPALSFSINPNQDLPCSRTWFQQVNLDLELYQNRVPWGTY